MVELSRKVWSVIFEPTTSCVSAQSTVSPRNQAFNAAVSSCAPSPHSTGGAAEHFDWSSAHAGETAISAARSPAARCFMSCRRTWRILACGPVSDKTSQGKGGGTMADHNDPNAVNSIFSDIDVIAADLYAISGFPAD